MIAPESVDAWSTAAHFASPLIRAPSLEATLPKRSELDELRDALPPATPIFVSAPPNCAHARLAEVVRWVRQCGFEPVPHITARSYASREALSGFIEQVVGESNVRRALVLAGDLAQPRGPFSGANAVIESDLLQQHGINDIAVSGYPDGHAKLSDGILNRAMKEKLKSAEFRNLRVSIVSQFCFDAERILTWIRSVREAGIHVPICIGIAGPASTSGLARFALRCGVRSSLKAIAAGKATQLLADIAPDELIERLGAARDLALLGDVFLHLYSFGGVGRTGRWLRACLARNNAAAEITRTSLHK